MGDWVLSKVTCLMFEAEHWEEIGRANKPDSFLMWIRELQPNETDDNITYAITFEPYTI